ASVLEVTGADGPLVAANEVFRPGPGGAAVPGTPPGNALLDALAAAGYYTETGGGGGGGTPDREQRVSTGAACGWGPGSGWPSTAGNQPRWQATRRGVWRGRWRRWPSGSVHGCPDHRGGRCWPRPGWVWWCWW